MVHPQLWIQDGASSSYAVVFRRKCMSKRKNWLRLGRGHAGVPVDRQIVHENGVCEVEFILIYFNSLCVLNSILKYLKNISRCAFTQTFVCLSVCLSDSFLHDDFDFQNTQLECDRKNRSIRTRAHLAFWHIISYEHTP